MSTPRAPRARRARGKYSSKACVQCRERKLKCSGEEPCQRCSRSKLVCLFSDDPTMAAEVLSQNRRTSIANLQRREASRSTIAAHHSPTTLSSMEVRMKSMESALRALAELIPRQTNSEGHVEPQEDGDGGDGFVGDIALQAPVDAFNAALAALRDQMGHQEPSPAASSTFQQDEVPGNPHAIFSPAGPSASSPDSVSQTTVQFGSERLPFPTPAQYSDYLDLVFDDINACHPCVNEADFRAKCSSILTRRTVSPPDPYLLATNYILFACCDVLTHVGSVQPNRRVPGWQWYVEADKLMGKRKISDQGNLRLLQFLVYEAFYLIHADNADAAYKVSGLACRLCFQLGLHQQRLWGENCTEFSRHMRQRLFWTVYFVDRRVSLSCGRPYGIRDSDLAVDLPALLNDKAVYPGRPLPEPDPNNANTVYLNAVTVFARLAGEVWDKVFSVIPHSGEDTGEKVAVLDAKIKYWAESLSQTMSPVLQGGRPSHRQIRQKSLVETRMHHLRLLLRRRDMVSLAYSATDGIVCGELAMEIVQDLQKHAAEIDKPSSFRFHMATHLCGAVLILATLLCRDLSTIGIQTRRRAYAVAYQDGIAMLRHLGASLPATGRILEDLKNIVEVVDLVLSQQERTDNDNNNGDHSLLDSHGDGITQIEAGGVDRGDIFMDVIPANIDDLFPYEPVDSTLHFTGFDPGSFSMVGGPSAMESMSNPADGHQGAAMSWDTWDDLLLRSEGGFGVPWI